MVKIIHYSHSFIHGSGFSGLSETDPQKAMPEYKPWREGLVINTSLSLSEREDGSHEMKPLAILISVVLLHSLDLI